MTAAKSALKAAKAALDAKEFETAVEEARKVIAADSKNYHGHVFLGLALEKKDENAASEETYRRATDLKNNDALAWQGLLSLYEKQSGKELDKYHDVALRLAEIYMQADDKLKCQSVLDKYTSDAKKYGSRNQYKRSLELLLPTCTIYDYLEGRIPQPAQTYIRIADIVETEEREKINSEIGQRRTRLGARIDQVTAEVQREVLESSPLERLYTDIVNWTQDDEVRRRYEEKLLQHSRDTLVALPTLQKGAKREQVMTMARGLVILKHRFLLAWMIVLEWNDPEDVSHLDAALLQDFVELFPDDALGKVIKGFLESEISPFPKTNISTPVGSDEEGTEAAMPAEDRLILMTEGLEDAPRSILAHRLMSQYYLYLDEYESAVSTARKGLQCISSESVQSGLRFMHTFDAVNALLATALIRYQTPRHHAEARELFETILARKPKQGTALVGIGMIYEEQEEYAAAVNFLDQALGRSDDPKIKAEAAWCKALANDHETALHELNASLAAMEGSDPKMKSLRSQTLYRIGKCLWSLDSSRSSRKDRNGAYAHFLASLQADMNFAPAYTSLGVYYADYGRDKNRARKCFQKAFELSAFEVEAAYRLAQAFAQAGDWDLVEVVAQRVVESGKTRPAPGSKKRPISWPYAALGVVQLNHQDYAKSIVSFQSALRLSSDDYYSFVGLGESYHHSGRYMAALKTFEHAQHLQGVTHDESGWFCDFMLANVQRELGEYEEANLRYSKVREKRPDEYGVCIALLQSLVEAAWRSVELGFFGRAADSAKEAIDVGRETLRIRSDGFNLWKAVGDACSVFSSIRGYESDFPFDMVKSLLHVDADLKAYENLAHTDHVDWGVLQKLSQDDSSTAPASMIATILAQKRAVDASAFDAHARAVAWYNLGWTEHRAFMGCNKSDPSPQASNFLNGAVQAFKRAIELEAGNAEFWNSLGIVTSDASPKVAQHSFVRSLYLDEKSARTWTNLGVLYLLQADKQLANEAFTRAQSADPDYAQAWLGQGLLAAKASDRTEARHLFTHAFEIVDSSNTIIKHEYSAALFDHIVSSSSIASDTLQPLLALHQLRAQKPSDLSSQHLSSMFAERAGSFDDALAALESVCSRLESEYEDAESALTLARFGQAKADLARAQLATRDFAAAAQNAETALDLSTDDEQTSPRQKVRLSAHMTAGLAHYFLGSMDPSIDMFKSALSETQGNPDIVCLLAQVLWAKGGENERDVAREQLLDCLEKHPGNVNSTTLLGCIAILDDDQDTLEAVQADLESLRSDDNLSVLEQSRIIQLLAAIPSVQQEATDNNLLGIVQAQRSVMLHPSRPYGWSQLAAISDGIFPAEVGVLAAVKAAPPGGELGAQYLCSAYASTGRLSDAQRAVMIAPFKKDGWEALCW